MKATLKNKETYGKLHDLLDKVYQLFYLTSGQCMIYDKDGYQISELQAEFANGESNIWLLKQIAGHAEKLYIAKVWEWAKELDKDEFFRVTNLNKDFK